MIQKNLKLISLTTVLAGLLFFSTPFNANADEKIRHPMTIMAALLVINGLEDGKTKIPTGQARGVLKSTRLRSTKVQDKVNEISQVKQRLQM